MTATKAFTNPMLRALKQERRGILDPTTALSLPMAVIFPIMLMYLFVGNSQERGR